VEDLRFDRSSLTVDADLTQVAVDLDIVEPLDHAPILADRREAFDEVAMLAAGEAFDGVAMLAAGATFDGVTIGAGGAAFDGVTIRAGGAAFDGVSIRADGWDMVDDACIDLSRARPRRPRRPGGPRRTRA
jgi:hypothetical protein